MTFNKSDQKDNVKCLFVYVKVYLKHNEKEIVANFRMFELCLFAKLNVNTLRAACFYGNKYDNRVQQTKIHLEL